MKKCKCTSNCRCNCPCGGACGNPSRKVSCFNIKHSEVAAAKAAIKDIIQSTLGRKPFKTEIIRLAQKFLTHPLSARDAAIIQGVIRSHSKRPKKNP